jgi:NADH:ubiquinone oxidoreductase subunit 6 (subunit J)
MSGFPASSLVVSGIFAVFAAMTIAGALIAALSLRIIRSVCGLALCSVGLAGLYYFLHSPFLALMEILVYVGAVCVTIVFAIMLAEPEESARQEERGTTLTWGAAALAISGAICGGIAWLSLQQHWTAPATRVTDGSVRAIGVAFLTTYSLAFELISLVLLVAILGALAIARSGRTRP